jgi:SNF2 family DNA or RNA helicase
MSAVLGELDPSGQFIHIQVVGGDAYELDQAASVLRGLTMHANPTATRDVMSVPATWAAVTQLAHGFPGGQAWDGREALTWTPGPLLCDWMIAEILRRACEGEAAGQAPALDPMKHQSAGALAIGMNGRFLLADDMGTGKSGTYLMGLAELDARGRYPWPALFVTPASVVDTVVEEIPKWYPGWKAAAYRGGNRAKYLKSNARILVMGYETMRNDTGSATKPGPLLKYGAGTVIFDEVHALCNYNSVQSKQARKLAEHTRNVVGGSGTPITQNVAGFWPVLHCLYPGAYPNRERFKAHYCISRGKAQYGNGDAEVTGIHPLREAEFRTEMQGVFRRVAIEDVVDMPPLTWSTRYVDIPPAWRAAYEQMESDMLAELPDSITPLEAMTAIVKMTRLRQLACSACDVEVTREVEMNPHSPNYGQEVAHTEVTLKEPCWKGAALVDLLRELHEGEGEFDELGGQHGHVVGSRPLLAFAESQQLTRLTGQMAEKKGYSVGYIDGKVPLGEPRNRVRRALEENKLDLLCVTTGAGGVGLNLIAARDVAFLAQPWGYVPSVQSVRRSWRRGQEKPVQVYDFVAKNTVESRVREKLRGKAGNLADLMQDRRIVEGFLGGRRD